MRPVIVPATAELTEAYFGRKPLLSFRGWVCLLDGKPAGLCGLYFENGQPFAFGDIGEPLRPHRRALVKGVRLVQEMMDESTCPVLAIEDRDEPTAPSLLKRLGFRPTGYEREAGRVLVRMPP